MVKLRATKRVYYGGVRYDVGDMFDVDPKHVKVIMGMGASRVPMKSLPPPPVEKKEAVKKEEKPKKKPTPKSGVYKRRDMTAETPRTVEPTGAAPLERADLKPEGETT